MRPHMLPASVCVSAYTASSYIASVLTYRAVYMLAYREGRGEPARSLQCG
jgi:hypothetical protein